MKFFQHLMMITMVLMVVTAHIFLAPGAHIRLLIGWEFSVFLYIGGNLFLSFMIVSVLSIVEALRDIKKRR